MDHRQVHGTKIVLLISSLACLAVLFIAAYQENFHGEWRTVQQRYGDLLLETATTDAARRSASSFKVTLKQQYLPDIETIDRCTTCHLGVENPGMVDALQPLTTHPGEWLGWHPPEKFGCTICHHGVGRGTQKASAHGWQSDGTVVPHIETPLLRDDAVFTSCGRCHAENDLYGGQSDLFAGASGGSIDRGSLEQSLPGADRLAQGKKLMTELGCLGCHKYRGRGGTLGADLTHVGDKGKHGFDFSHVRGEHTVEQWLFEHFKYPQEVSPGTVMPDMELTDDEARDLALYMMSLKRKSAPASHIPRSRVREGGPVRGSTLYGMFCSSCHGRDGHGTTTRQGLWPTNADPWGHHWDRTDIVVERRSSIDVVVPSLHHPDTLAVASDDYLRRIIARGRPGTKMLGWADEGGLSDDEITLLVDFVRGWDEPVPDLDAVSAARGDMHVGAALYRANCAACHGRSGEGGIGVSLNSPTFLAVASDAFLRDTIVYGRPNTAMPAWREFNAREISDLLAYMRDWQPPHSDFDSALARCSDAPSADVSADIGAILYKANCTMCHGADGSGDLGPSINTQAFLTAVLDGYLVKTMIEGRPGTGMPSWRHLSNDDIASIIQHLRTWQTKDSMTEEWHAQSVTPGDWDAGRHLFTGHCSGCHGSDGEGATGPQLNNPVFLETVSNVMLRHWITNGKEGTEMRGFRKGGQGITELSDRQIEDLIAYLRLLERTEPDEITRVSKSPHGRPRRGATIYAQQCVSCHGDRGEGTSGPALSNPNFLRFASDGFLMATMAMGRRGTEMRPVKRGPQSILSLSSDDVNDLVAFLRSWEHDPPFGPGKPQEIPHRFVVPWDLAHGRELFRSNCAGCHGDEGRNSWAPELNNEGFLSAATDGFLQATIVRGRTGTAMRPFGQGAHGVTDLTSQDIDDIVAYMRHWSTETPSPMTIPAEHSLVATPFTETHDANDGAVALNRSTPLKETSHE